MGRQIESVLPVTSAVVATADEAVSAAQLVITTTPARQPLLYRSALHQTLHITAVGSDAPGKRELSDCLLRKLDLYVADSLEQCAKFGELQTMVPQELARVAVLGDLVSGRTQGRINEHQTTVADLTGLGIQDTAIAIEALKRLTALA